MKKKTPTHGKISEHFKGIGTVTAEMVMERAREIALINGRQPNQYSQDDFEEAKRELTGAEPEVVSEDPNDAVAEVVTWDESADESGHVVPREKLEDENSAPMQLVEGGVEEAGHEQMVEGARNPHNQE